MPIGRKYDFEVGGKGFMLARNQYKGRAWTRTGAPDTPSSRSYTDAKYGQLDDTVDHPEVWEDWSGGYGHPYRRNGENTYHWAENFDARFPRQLVHCQTLLPIVEGSAIIGNMETITDVPATYDTLSNAAGAVLWCRRGSVSRRTATTTPNVFEKAGDHPTAQLYYGRRGAVYGSYIYVPNISGSNFHRINLDFLEFTATQSPMPGTNFVVAGDRMWRTHGPVQKAKYLQSIANNDGGAVFSASNWSATLNVGAGYGINDIAVLEDQLCVGMPDGVYVGDATGTFVNVFGELSKQAHKDNCRDLIIYNGGLVTQHIAGIYSYQSNGYSSAVRRISPIGDGRSPVRGFPRALGGYSGWLYAGYWTGSASYITAGQPGANGDYVWHTQQRLPSFSVVHRIHFDGITGAGVAGTIKIPNHIWVATDPSGHTGTAPVYVANIPTLNGNPLAPELPFTPNYIGSARMDLGAVDWGAPSTPKLYRAVDIWADNLASGAQWCKVYYTVDEAATRHLLGTSAKSPKNTLYFPAGEGSFVTGQSIALSLESFTASAGVTPVYRSIVLRGALMPNSVDQITAVVRIADNMADRQGHPMRSAAAQIADLRALAQSISPVQLVDLAGATSYVSVQRPIQESETYQQGSDEPEIAATVRMSVLDFGG